MTDPNQAYSEALEDPEQKEMLLTAIRWSETFKDCWFKEFTGGKRHDKHPQWQATIDEMYANGLKQEDVQQCFMDAKWLAERWLNRN